MCVCMWICVYVCQVVEVTLTTGWVRCQQQAMEKQSWRSLLLDSSCFIWSKAKHTHPYTYAHVEEHVCYFFFLSFLRSVSRGSQRFSPGLHEVQSGGSGWGGDIGPSRSLGCSLLQCPNVLGCTSGRHPALWSVWWGTPDSKHQHPTLTQSSEIKVLNSKIISLLLSTSCFAHFITIMYNLNII